jgi:hypothetical protein
MKTKINRRTFLQKSAGLLAAVTASAYHGGTLFAREYTDIAVVEGESPMEQTRKALEILYRMRSGATPGPHSTLRLPSKSPASVAKRARVRLRSRPTMESGAGVPLWRKSFRQPG